MKFLALAALFLIAATWLAVTLIGVAIKVAVYVTLGILAISAIGWAASKLKSFGKPRVEGPRDLTPLP
jgi:hypothetical protein